MATFSLTFDPPSAVPENHVDRIALIRALGDLYAAVPMVRFRTKVDVVPPPPPGYSTFTWHFEFVDGRLWDEIHTYADAPSTELPFMKGSFGEADVFGYHIDVVALLRPIRDLSFRMIPAFGLTDIHAKWV